jgi:uroporphyrin-III C-methyltransferase/precorrin-2 dehydrogenase/sirohydrochlorin ferrochelatase
MSATSSWHGIVSIPALAEAAKLMAPTLIIVGEVVRLHAQLAWFDPETRQATACVPVARTAMAG